MTQTLTVDKLRAMAAAVELLDALKAARRALAWVVHVDGVSVAYVHEALEVIDAALSKAEAK